MRALRTLPSGPPAGQPRRRDTPLVEAYRELFADRFSVKTIREELGKILPDGEGRSKMLSEYDIIDDRLGNDSAPENAARQMIAKLT